MKYIYLSVVLFLLTACNVDNMAQSNLYPAPKTGSTKGVGIYNNDEGPVIFYLHGNGEDISLLEKAGVTIVLSQSGKLIVPEYPGYGPVQGRPSQASVLETSIMEFRKARQGGRKIFIVGRSLGAAVAAQMARTESPDGLILISPWLSAKKAAQDNKSIVIRSLVKMVSVDFWSKNSWDSISALKEYVGRGLVIHGKDDSLIPHAHGVQIARDHGWDIITINSGHNDIYSKPDTWSAIQDFIK